MEAPSASLEWFPVRILGRRFEDVPEIIANAASEAFACYTIRSFRASVLLARAVVEAIAKDLGQTKGTLYAKIEALGEKNIVSPLMVETAHEIRDIGNESAHGDFVRDISEEECDDVLNFMTSLLEEVYQRPANLTRFRELRQHNFEKAEDSELQGPRGPSSIRI